MEFITKIFEIEALRREQYMKGPPIDIFGYYNDMGRPNSMALKYHGPGLIPSWSNEVKAKNEFILDPVERRPEKDYRQDMMNSGEKL